METQTTKRKHSKNENGANHSALDASKENDADKKHNKRLKVDPDASANTRNALLVIDVQNDFCTGSMKVPGAEDIVPLINSVRDLFDVVVFSKDWHPKDHCSFKSDIDGQVIRNGDNTDWWPIHCVQGTPGAELHPKLTASPQDIIVTKGENPLTESYSAFWDTQKTKTTMEEELHKEAITDVFVCGLATDYCVSHTALNSVEAGFRTYFLPDLSRGTEQDLIEARCKFMKEKGIQFLSLPELRAHLTKEPEQTTAEEEKKEDKEEGNSK